MASRVTKFRWLLVMAAALSLVAAVACGSADDEADEPTTAATDTTAAADTLAATDDDEKMDETAATQEDEKMDDTKEEAGGNDTGAAGPKAGYHCGDDDAGERRVGVTWCGRHRPMLPASFHPGCTTAPRPTKFTESPNHAELVRTGQPCGTYHGPSVSPSSDGGPQACPAIADRLPVTVRHPGNAASLRDRSPRRYETVLHDRRSGSCGPFEPGPVCDRGCSRRQGPEH